MASLGTRAARIRRSLVGLNMDEVVQVLEVALRDILSRQLDPDVSINVSFEHDDSARREPPEPPAWLAKHVSEHVTNTAADTKGILYGRTVSFTGDLASMTREDAAATVASLGGTPHVNVTHRTDVLVVGQFPGAKLDRARSYAARGQNVEIVDEQTFLRYLGGATFASEGRERTPTNAELQAAKVALAAINRSSRPRTVVTSAAVVELTCVSCGKRWERPSQRGRLPLLCPECRAAGVKL
jgi:BRCA1 C Terminus (BRCT) domain